MKKEKEIEVVQLMIQKYCNGVHKSKSGFICEDCKALLNYVILCRNRCPYGDNKPFCSNCDIHCYKPVIKSKIRSVMRYSGPRIILSHPLIAIRHLTESKLQKKQLNSKDRKNVR